jgi:hypothetical protein
MERGSLIRRSNSSFVLYTTRVAELSGAHFGPIFLEDSEVVTTFATTLVVGVESSSMIARRVDSYSVEGEEL